MRAPERPWRQRPEMGAPRAARATPVHLFLCNWYKVASDVYASDFRGQDDHAGEMETSMGLAHFPELVALEQADAGSRRPSRFEAVNEGWVEITRPWHLLDDQLGGRRSAGRHGRQGGGSHGARRRADRPLPEGARREPARRDFSFLLDDSRRSPGPSTIIVRCTDDRRHGDSVCGSHLSSTGYLSAGACGSFLAACSRSGGSRPAPGQQADRPCDDNERHGRSRRLATDRLPACKGPWLERSKSQESRE